MLNAIYLKCSQMNVYSFYMRRWATESTALAWDDTGGTEKQKQRGEWRNENWNTQKPFVLLDFPVTFELDFAVVLCYFRVLVLKI